MHRIGVVVNPIAGMGGRVGLKGTDGQVQAALERGATPESSRRARRALDALYGAAPETTIVAAGGVMGADVARDAGFDPTVLDVARTTADPYDTTAADTRAPRSSRRGSTSSSSSAATGLRPTWPTLSRRRERWRRAHRPTPRPLTSRRCWASQPA
jgi:hypothetical protein